MKIAVDMEIWWDGQDEMSDKEQADAIREMIQSGAESFNFDVKINSVEELVAPQIPDETLTAVEFLRGLQGFEDTCGSCKFMNDTTSECRKRYIVVKNNSPKCPQWRYFA